MEIEEGRLQIGVKWNGFEFCNFVNKVMILLLY